jgi:hypothetical protein
MLRGFFDTKGFALVNMLLQSAPFKAAYFVEDVTMPLATRNAQQRGDTARRKLHLLFDNFKCYTGSHVQKEMTRRG